jgi:hypothetical protein
MDPEYSPDNSYNTAYSPHNKLKRKRVSLVVDGQTVLPTDDPASPPAVISASQDDSEN